MAVLQLQQVGVRKVSILIHFVGVVRRDPCFRRKRELRHHIRYCVRWLLLRFLLLILRRSLLSLCRFDAALTPLFVRYLWELH
jgi:hypothetical protein